MSTESLAVENDGAARDGSPTTGDVSVGRSRSFWSSLDRLLERAGERFNPILVKETRQALKSQQFSLWFMLLLAGCWIVTIGGVAWIGPGVQYSASGGVLFLAYYFVLGIALIVVAPFAAYRSLAAEQEDNTRDVLMVSALTPSQVINGKIGSAVLQMSVYLAALAPCLAFSYLLRGIDLLTILLLPTLAVLASLGLSVLGLLIASAARQRHTQVLTSILLVAILFVAFGLCFMAAVAVISGGYQAFQEPEFWVAAGACLNLYVCAVLIAYFGAVAANAFATANRSTALRRVLFFTQACFVGWVTLVWIETGYESEPLGDLAFPAGVFWLIAGSMLTGEPPILSERVRRGLPESLIGRAFGSWFNPGAGTGYLFAVTNFGALLACASVALWCSNDSRTRVFNMQVMLLVMFCYLAVLLGVGRLIIVGLRRVANVSLLGCFLIHFLLLLSCIGLPELIRASVTRYGRAPFGWFDTTSPTRVLTAIGNGGVVDSADLLTASLMVGGAACCVLMVNLLLAAREVRQTRAPLPQRVIEDDAERSPNGPVVANPWGDLRRPE